MAIHAEKNCDMCTFVKYAKNAKYAVIAQN